MDLNSSFSSPMYQSGSWRSIYCAPGRNGGGTKRTRYVPPMIVCKMLARCLIGYWRGQGIAVRAGHWLHAIDGERQTNGHIGSRDDSSFCHQHSSIIAYRIEFA